MRQKMVLLVPSVEKVKKRQECVVKEQVLLGCYRLVGIPDPLKDRLVDLLTEFFY